MSIELSELKAEDIELINSQWNQQLDSLDDDASYLKSSVERIVDWCEKSIAQDDHCLYALSDNEKNSIRAIVEITDASKSKDPSFKFLNVYLEPNLINDHKDEIRQEDLLEGIKIIAFALVKSLKMAVNNGTKKLKVYARTDEMKNMFDSLVATSNPEVSGAVFYRQGKWLVIEKLKVKL